MHSSDDFSRLFAERRAWLIVCVTRNNRSIRPLSKPFSAAKTAEKPPWTASAYPSWYPPSSTVHKQYCFHGEKPSRPVVHVPVRKSACATLTPSQLAADASGTSQRKDVGFPIGSSSWKSEQIAFWVVGFSVSSRWDARWKWLASSAGRSVAISKTRSALIWSERIAR